MWVDANHDGKSWIDTDGDGIKGAGEATELHSLSELGITSINLSPTTQSGLVRDGNEILASGTFTLNGQTEEALAANFLYNPNGHTFTASGNGTVITTQGEIPADVVTAYSSRSSTGETMDVAVKGVRNAYHFNKTSGQEAIGQQGFCRRLGDSMMAHFESSERRPTKEVWTENQYGPQNTDIQRVTSFLEDKSHRRIINGTAYGKEDENATHLDWCNHCPLVGTDTLLRAFGA